jgi:betaine-aldehyde dehydrogenase
MTLLRSRGPFGPHPGPILADSARPGHLRRWHHPGLAEKMESCHRIQNGGLVVDELRNFIGGQWTDTSFDKRAELINPSTGEVFATAPLSREVEVDAAVSSAAAAFEGWRDATPSERSLALLRIADKLEVRADEFVAAEARNTGKPVGLTRSEEIPPMVDQIRFFAGAARMLEGRAAGEYMSGFTSFVRREPVGVCAAVTPWNYPMMMAVWKWAPALAAGNTMVLKPSDTTPVSTLLLAELMSEFLPPGVFNVVCGDRDTGRALVSHRVRGLHPDQARDELAGVVHIVS